MPSEQRSSKLVGVTLAFSVLALAVLAFAKEREGREASKPVLAPSTAQAAIRQDDPDALSGPRGQQERSRREEYELAQADAVGSAADPTTRRLSDATDDLAMQSTDAVYGVLELNYALDNLLSLSSLPISEHPDFDYEDNDALAYSFEGAPEGSEVRMLVGLQSYQEGDSTYRYLQIEVDVSQEEDEFIDGALREGPSVHASISYDVEDPTQPTRFAITLQRSVDIAACRDAGIDAYTGKFTEGAYYWHDLLDESKVSAMTFGIIDAHPESHHAFDGELLRGDTTLDKERVKALLVKLQHKLNKAKGD
jgi:hypothetical protein